jgi:hypothetical protein
MKIEVAIMYNRVKDLPDPKAVLEKIATLNCEMGWVKEPQEVRLMAYACWLKEHGKQDWYDYIEASAKALAVIVLGGIPGGIPEVPAGWIEPRDYLDGRPPKEKK